MGNVTEYHLYVDSASGLDGGFCTIDAPCKSFDFAVSFANNWYGDYGNNISINIIDNGSYHEWNQTYYMYGDSFDDIEQYDNPSEYKIIGNGKNVTVIGWDDGYMSTAAIRNSFDYQTDITIQDLSLTQAPGQMYQTGNIYFAYLQYPPGSNQNLYFKNVVIGMFYYIFHLESPIGVVSEQS